MKHVERSLSLTVVLYREWPTLLQPAVPGQMVLKDVMFLMDLGHLASLYPRSNGAFRRHLEFSEGGRVTIL